MLNYFYGLGTLPALFVAFLVYIKIIDWYERWSYKKRYGRFLQPVRSGDGLSSRRFHGSDEKEGV